MEPLGGLRLGRIRTVLVCLSPPTPAVAYFALLALVSMFSQAKFTITAHSPYAAVAATSHFSLQLRKRMYWVIASVLAAYWAREMLSMWMAARYFSSLTFRMVVLSTLYHTGKISLITVDARRG